jgi:two-component system, NarL family, response regulator YdfI
MIHVLVDPSSPDLQAEIADLLRDRPEFRLIANSGNTGNSAGEISGGEGGEDGEGQPHPDVVIVDDPSESALDTAGWSVAGVPIILLTDHSARDADNWGPNAEHGSEGGFSGSVRGVLPRNVTRAELTAAIEAVAAGLFVFHPADADLFPALRPRETEADAGSGPSPSPGFSMVPPLNDQLVEPLTRREIEVLQLLAAGLGNKEIAARLHISEHTAKFHVASILSKLGAATRTEAVTLGIRRGLVMI